MSKDDRILLRMCKMSGREMDFIREAFEEEWVVPLGPNVTGFEKDLKAFLHSDGEVVALVSGTSALHLALLGCGVGPGDEVMVQSFSFSATANPIVYAGGVPVFVDSEEETWNMDPGLLDRAIAERERFTGKRPKAILPCYLYGMPAKIDEIREVAARWEIPLVEDAAEALGSRYDGRFCGTFGRYGALSFNGNKMITTSGGGALVCARAEDARKALYLATQAREGYPYYHHTDIGFNYRLSNISAGIGRGQMTVIEDYLRHHRHRQTYYAEHLADVAGITIHGNPSERFDSNFWLTTALLDEEARVEGRERAYSHAGSGTVGSTAGVTGNDSSLHTDCEPDADVEALRLAMADARIETRPLWKPLHRQPVFASSPAYVNGVSERLFRRGICLPSGPWVTDEDADRVIDVIRQNVK